MSPIRIPRLRFCLIAFFVFAAVGCAHKSREIPASLQKPFSADLGSIMMLNVVQYESVPFRKADPSTFEPGEIRSAKDATGSASSGGVGESILRPAKNSAEKKKWKMAEASAEKVLPNLPDFTTLVRERLMSRARSEIANWPPVAVSGEAMTEGRLTGISPYDYRESRPLLILKAGAGYGSVDAKTGDIVFGGLIAIMRDTQNNIVWQRALSYNSADFKRDCQVEKLEAQNGQLLAKEMEFAADRLVDVLIEDIKGGMKK